MASPLAQAYLQAMSAGTSPQPFHATVQPTDVEKAYGDYNNAMMQAYAAEVGKQNAMFGGMAGLAGAGISTLPKLLSGTGTAAAGATDLAPLATSIGLDATDIGAGATLADALPMLLAL